MISKKMTQAINEQINKELFSGYLYKSMAVYAVAEGLPGTAHWMTIQEGEERIHAQKFMDYLLDQGEQVVLAPIAGPDTKFNGLKDLFEKTLAHEKIVTAAINTLADLAAKDILILGHVNGNVVASGRVELRAGCVVEGDIRALRLAVEDNAVFRGKVDLTQGVSKPLEGSGGSSAGGGL